MKIVKDMSNTALGGFKNSDSLTALNCLIRQERPVGCYWFMKNV